MVYLDEHKLLSDRQHAFQRRHSCETQLITAINDSANILNKGEQVDTFILDFEKATHRKQRAHRKAQSSGQKKDWDRFKNLQLKRK